MPKGLIRAFAGSSLNFLIGRTNRHLANRPREAQHFHFVFAHSDDELAVLKPLRIIANTPNLSASFTLLSNGTQGYEQNDSQTREEFGEMRVREFRNSLSSLGFTDVKTDSLLDERKIYKLLIGEDLTELGDALDFAKREIIKDIMVNKPQTVFVDDFAGGNIVHDIANYLTCKACQEAKFEPVVEYWQYFFDKASGAMIVGDLGSDEQGRVLRDSCPGKYSVEIPALGIHNGRMFLSPFDIIRALKHKNKIYGSQEKTLNRLTDITFASYGIDAPHFREIKLGDINYKKRPEHGVLYEQAHWRLRGLERLPEFKDFARMVQHYEKM